SSQHASSLSHLKLSTLIRSYLEEDCPGNFDIGGYTVGSDIKTAHLYLKSSGVLAGVPFVNAVFKELECTVKWMTSAAIEGKSYTYTERPILLATITGPANSLLFGERTALNILSRCSGVSTVSNRYAELAKDWSGTIAGTRKTTPGFRLIEKYGLLVSNVDTHRLDLSHMVMLKDNHIWSHGSITLAIKKARSGCGFTSKIEVECRNLEEGLEAGEAGADVIMLDNYIGCEVENDAREIKEMYPGVIIEVSGGITEESLEEYLQPSVDVISVGKLTQGYECLDFSLKIQ
ncbi:hypothetical protein TL16_g09771, partial [Triparma laevis f. inornata]